MYIIFENMIRQIQDNNIEDIMDIWLKTNINAHNFIPKEYWINNYYTVKEKYLPVSKTYIYEENNTIKGFISIVNKSFIGALFVLEEFQGKGIGSVLLNYCKSLYPYLELNVYSKNINAVNFYKNSGFAVITEQINTDSGYTELVMVWHSK